MAAVVVASTASPAYNAAATDPTTADGQWVFVGLVVYASGAPTMPAGWDLVTSRANTDGGRPIYLYVYRQKRTSGALSMAPISVPGDYLQCAVAVSGLLDRSPVTQFSSAFTTDASVTQFSIPSVTSVALGSLVLAFLSGWDKGLSALDGLSLLSEVGTPAEECQAWGAAVGHGSQGPFVGTPETPNDTFAGIALALTPASVDGNVFAL